jgi:hypothetical protein
MNWPQFDAAVVSLKSLAVRKFLFPAVLPFDLIFALALRLLLGPLSRSGLLAREFLRAKVCSRSVALVL